MTTQAAATALGVTTARVRQLIAEGKLHAEKRGRDWHITPRAIRVCRERYMERRTANEAN